MLLLVNNVVLLAALLTVLFGTLFPLFMDGLGFGKYSVGPPYFNSVFVPLMAILIVFMGIGPNAHWKRTRADHLRRQLLMAAVVSVVVGLVFPLVYAAEYNIWVALAVCFAAWIVASLVVSIKEKTSHASSLLVGMQRLGRAYYGMLFGHLGFACCVIGVCLTSQYSLEQDLRMMPGERLELANYQFQFQGTRPIEGPNYRGDEGVITVFQDGKTIATLHPQKRSYNAQQGQVMTEAAIDNGLFRDLYVALGEPLGDGAWAVRVHYKPFVRWMWLGALLMAFGGALAAADKRYRMAVRERLPSSMNSAAEAA
jgi:cytochrome c-type biogenesis protein CcmF